MKRVLLTTDFSVVSENAVRYMLNLLGNHACEFTFLHAYYSFPSDSSAEASIAYFETIYSHSKTSMRKFIASSEQADTRQIHTFKSLLLPASPAGALRFLSYQHDFDLIVAGTKSQRDDMFFGNLTTDIVRNVPGNAIIVPENVNMAPLRNVVLAVDAQSICSLAELASLKAILQANNAALTLLTTLKNKAAETDLSMLPTYDYHYFFKGIEVIDYPVYARNLEEGINKYLNFHEADMLVTVNRQRSFWEGLFNRSLTSKLALNATVPYMSVYSKAASTHVNKETSTFNLR